MERNLYSEFQNCCDAFFDCPFCPLYSLSGDMPSDCEEIFRCLSEKFQVGIIERMREKIAEWSEERNKNE